MKKAMSIAIAALMVVGMTTAFAGEGGGCPGKKAEKKAECSAEKTTACSSEKKAECQAKKADNTADSQEV
jgi:hypothetical protein